MIGDPLFYQRLLRLLSARGATPQAFGDVLGSVVSIDASLLLERAGAGKLSSATWMATGGFAGAAPVANSRTMIVNVGRRFGTASPSNDQRIYDVDLLAFSFVADVAMNWYLQGDVTIVDGAIAALVIPNLDGASHPQVGKSEAAGGETATPFVRLDGAIDLNGIGGLRGANTPFEFRQQALRWPIRPAADTYFRMVGATVAGAVAVNITYWMLLGIFPRD